MCHRRIRCRKEAVKEIFKAAIKNYDKHQHQILTKYSLKKSLYVIAEEIETQLLKMIKQYQLEFKFEEDF